jgi:anti-anti-sigma factor
MELAERFHHGVAVVEIKDKELSHADCHDFQHQALDIFERQNPHSLAVNLKNVDFLDSMGIGTLITLRNRLLKDGGTVALCELNDNVKRVVNVASLHKVFSIYDSEEEAVKELEN